LLISKGVERLAAAFAALEAGDTGADTAADFLEAYKLERRSRWFFFFRIVSV
jgi:hypothetical protein